MKKILMAALLFSAGFAQAAEVAATAGVMSVTYVSGGISGMIHEKFSEKKDGLNKEALIAAKDDAAMFVATQGEFGKSAVLMNMIEELSSDAQFSNLSEMQLAEAIAGIEVQ